MVDKAKVQSSTLSCDSSCIVTTKVECGRARCHTTALILSQLRSTKNLVKRLSMPVCQG